MNTTPIARCSGKPRRRNLVSWAGLGVTAFAFAVAWLCPATAFANYERKIVLPADHAAQSLDDQYRQQQWTRLAKHDDRDSLIAAVLLGLPDDTGDSPFEGQAEVEHRLAAKFGKDADAMFVLTLACQEQKQPCTHPEYHDALVRIAPGNAVNWLMLPNDATPSAAQLHAAASAPMADSYLSTVTRILRKELADQPAPVVIRDIDPRELAAALRRDAVGAVPQPYYGPVLRMCKPPSAASRSDCIELGRRLVADRSGTLLARMIGGTMLRRLEKGTPEEASAKELRRDYVWMDEQLDDSDGSFMEQVQRDTIDLGEWVAYQHAVERMGKSSTPPAGWVPRNPQTLLLSEERTD
ncbi:MAG TPA: hypothetical protein VGH80_00675 [Xanthomonadaceae bacterium]